MVELPSGVRCVRRGRRVYYYFHPHRGTQAEVKPVRLPGAPTDPEFWRALKDAGATGKADPQSFAALVPAYRASPETSHWRSATRRDYDIYLRRIEHDWSTLNRAFWKTIFSGRRTPLWRHAVHDP